MNEDIMDTMIRVATEAIRNAYTIDDEIAAGACV